MARKWRIGKPTERCCSLRGEEARDRNQRPEAEEPVGQGVETRERHIGRTNLERHQHVRKARKQRGGEHQKHDCAVHREELVVLLFRGNNFEAGGKQLCTNDQRHDATDEEVGK